MGETRFPPCSRACERPSEAPVSGIAAAGASDDPQSMRIFDESGQTMAEYGVALTVITIGCITAIAFLAGEIVSAYERAAAFIL